MSYNLDNALNDLDRKRKVSSPAKLVYSVTETAAMLGISRSSAYEYVRKGDLPSISVGGRKLVPHRALTRMLEAA